MGVAGLWDILRPASKTRSLTEIAVKDGFEKNTDGVRGYRIGIDASIWFFHMEYGREGENPHLRTLFFRCATLMRSPFLPLFVFDGPKRPDFKRGKKVNKAPNKLIPSMKQIVEAFGFEHRTAPGEAEAELAYLNSTGVIDGVLSDDVDNFLFGALTVIRNPSNSLSGNRSNPVLNSAGKDDKNHSWVYELSDITTHPDIGLSRGGLILIGLLSGGDYQQGGLERCGMKTAVALAKCGFGDSLYKAATTLRKEQLPAFLDSWRQEVRHEITTNSRGLIGRKMPSLAKALTKAFPDIEILLSYVNPLTSQTMGKPYQPGDIKWEREPDISKLAGVCEFYFEWGYKESIIKRFRTVIWHSAVQRILRRAVLDLDQGIRPAVMAKEFATPSKSGRGLPEPCGTPSKMITKYFSTMNIADGVGKGEGEDEERLIVKVHSTRTHVSTDGLLEYRVEVSPGQLVGLAEHGIQGIREKPVQEWEDDDTENEGGDDQASNDPMEHMRLWMPACMVNLVEPGLVQDYEELVERKLAKKAGKGKGRKKKAPADGSEGASPPKAKATRTGKPPAKATQDDDDAITSRARGAKATTSTAGKSKGKAIPALAGFSSDDDSDQELPSPSRLFNSKPKTVPRELPADVGFFTSTGDFVPSPSPRRRIGVRDLTKKKTTTTTTAAYVEVLATTSPKRYVPSTKASAPALLTKTKTAVSIRGKAKAKESVSVLNATISKKSAFPEPKRVAAPFPLSFFDDDKDDADDFADDLLDYGDIFSSPVYLPPVFPPSISSPSKGRSYRQRKSSGSESDSRARYQKSPRKSAAHASPMSAGRIGRAVRAASPTPQSRVGVGKNIKPLSKTAVGAQIKRPENVESLPVYEIMSDSEEDMAMAVKKASVGGRQAPLVKAREPKKVQLSNVQIDFIDLT